MRFSIEPLASLEFSVRAGNSLSLHSPRHLAKVAKGERSSGLRLRRGQRNTYGPNDRPTARTNRSTPVGIARGLILCSRGMTATGTLLKTDWSRRRRRPQNIHLKPATRPLVTCFVACLRIQYMLGWSGV